MPDPNDASSSRPNRRRLLKGVTAFALPFSDLGPGSDPALAVAKQWCWLEAERRRLIIQWQDVETGLSANRNWPKLTKSAPAAEPEGVQLRAIDDQLDEIDKLYDALLPVLKKTSATTREGLFARFEALLHCVVQDENPDAHAILVSCLCDLKRLWQ